MSRPTAESLHAIFAGADPASLPPPAPRPVDDARVAEIRASLVAEGDALSLWRDSAETAEFLADLLSGVEMNPAIFRLAMKAAREGYDAETITAHLGAVLDASEAHGSRPDRVAELTGQLGGIVKRAVAAAGTLAGGGDAPPGAEFTPVDETDEIDPDDPRALMFRDFVWCEALQRAIEVSTGLQLNQTQLDRRMFRVGPPGDRKKSAWAIFAIKGENRRSVASLTFRPGAGRLVDEPGLGLCVNTWLPRQAPLPACDGDQLVQVFLDHAAFVIPDAGEARSLSASLHSQNCERLEGRRYPTPPSLRPGRA